MKLRVAALEHTNSIFDSRTCSQECWLVHQRIGECLVGVSPTVLDGLLCQKWLDAAVQETMESVGSQLISRFRSGLSTVPLLFVIALCKSFLYCLLNACATGIRKVIPDGCRTEI